MFKVIILESIFKLKPHSEIPKLSKQIKYRLTIWYICD